MLALQLLACRSPEVHPPPVHLVGEPSIEEPDSDSVRLVRRLVGTTDRPARLSVLLDDGIRPRRIRWDALATDFDVPLLELHPDTTYELTATFTDEHGGTAETSLSFDSGPVFEGLPHLDLLASDPDRAEPGYTVFSAEYTHGVYVLVVDLDGKLVWAWKSLGGTRALTLIGGEFGALLGTSAAKFDPLGNLLSLWTPSFLVGYMQGDLAPIPIDVNSLSHEVAFLPDGSFWSIYKAAREVAHYPASYTDPSITAPATIDDDHVVHIAPDGTVLSDWSMVDRLDPERIGFNSLDINPSHHAYDWGHGNAVVPLPDEDAVLVSLRHQDTVVKLTGPNGDLKWILANHDGWSEALQPYLLTPVGDDFSWQYHQHAPMVGKDGRITLFDNGDYGRTTPYSQHLDPHGDYTRLAQYRVDDDARTIELLWTSFGDPNFLYTSALGNADEQPTTGDVLGTFPYLHREDGPKNLDIGRGDLTVRIIEVTPEDDVVFDLDVWLPKAESPTGLLTDRAIRVPTLYGAGVEEDWP